jgi:hypothetical protein
MTVVHNGGNAFMSQQHGHHVYKSHQHTQQNGQRSFSNAAWKNYPVSGHQNKW